MRQNNYLFCYKNYNFLYVSGKLISTRSVMKLFTLSLLCTVFSLSTAKRRIGKLRGHFDDMGYFHKSEMGLLQASSVASVQQPEPGREICQSATYSHTDLTTYVHICESGFDSQGKLLLILAIYIYNYVS